MSTAIQNTFDGMENIAKRQMTPGDLLEIALRHNAAIDVIERLAALQRQHNEREAEMAFNDALNACQTEMGRIAPDLTNTQTKSKYASYAAIDKVIRPIYTKHGFSISFSEEPMPPDIEMVRIICYASHAAGHTRKYMKDMPADGKGAKGGDVMTKTHARAAADSYAKRYIVKDIFNLAIGEEDTDGNLTNSEVVDYIAKMEKAKTPDDLGAAYKEAFKDASKKQAYKTLGILTQKYEQLKADFNARD